MTPAEQQRDVRKATSIPNDHRVSFRSEESLLESAEQFRRLVRLPNCPLVDMVRLVNSLIGRKFGNSGILEFRKYSSDAEYTQAFVSYEPLRLNVDSELWELAKYGGPQERFVLAHEVGHIVLHNKDAKKFTGKAEEFGLFGSVEHSAEWQADVWALYFLIPDNLVLELKSENEIALQCGVEAKIARLRMQHADRRKIGRPRMEGDACPECANFTLVRNGTCLNCETCGGTAGCS